MFGEGEGDVRVCEGEGTLVGVFFVESIADQGNSTSSLDQSKGFPTRSSRLKTYTMKIQSMIYDSTSSLEMCAIAAFGDMGPIFLSACRQTANQVLLVYILADTNLVSRPNQSVPAKRAISSGVVARVLELGCF